MSSTQQSAALAPLLTLEEYQQTRERCFPSAGSLEWYLRMHRSKLIEAGAMLKHRGIWHVHADRFDQAVMDIAQASSKLAAA
jgi:hypothetical protein